MTTDKAVNPKDLIGATKAPLGVMAWSGIAQMAPVFAVGAEKYGPLNWREYKVQRVTYLEAALRHILADLGGETVDPETGLLHVAHAAAGLCILMDALACGMSVDNRPLPGNTAEILKLVSAQAKDAVAITRLLRGDTSVKPADAGINSPVPPVDSEARVVSETVRAEDGSRSEPFTRAGPPTPRAEPERSGGFGTVTWGGGVDEEDCNCMICRSCRKERFSGLEDYRASVKVNADLRVPYLDTALPGDCGDGYHHGTSKVLLELAGAAGRLLGVPASEVNLRSLQGPEPSPFPGGD